MTEEAVILAAAVAHLHQRVVRIRYRAANLVETLREVEIYRYDERCIDTFCRHRGAVRTFRLSNVLEIQVLEERFERKPEIVREVEAKGGAIDLQRAKTWLIRMIFRNEHAAKAETLALFLRAGEIPKGSDINPLTRDSSRPRVHPDKLAVHPRSTP